MSVVLNVAVSRESIGARSSDSSDFARALDPHVPSLRRAARALARDYDRGEDLVQETLLRAHRFAHRFEPGSNLRAWLHRILSNVFASERRRARREREVLERHHEEQLGEDASEPLEDEVSPSLEQGIAALHPELRSVFLLVALDDLSYRETAERLGCPIGTVMSRLHRARKALHARACAVREAQRSSVVAPQRAA